MHRFFVENNHITGSQIFFPDEEARHIEKVLRLRPGQMVVVFDGSGWEYKVQLDGVQEGRLVGQVVSREYVNRESPFKIVLVQGIAKGEKMDTIIQKAVEIGVNSIQPVLTEHTVVQLDGPKVLKKTERWQTIAREACKQCRRNHVPQVLPVQDYTSFLSTLQGKPALMLYEYEHQNTLKRFLKEQTDLALQQPWYLIVGPEGGFSDREAAMSREAGVQLLSLGPRILRTETAGLVAAGIILYEMEDINQDQYHGR